MIKYSDLWALWWCVRTKCKLNNVELFLNLFYIQSNETGNRKYYEEARELAKWQSDIFWTVMLESRRRTSWRLNAIKTKFAFVKSRLNFSSKTVQQQPMFYYLDSCGISLPRWRITNYYLRYIEDITRWREDMNVMFEWQEQYLTSERSERVRYCSCLENIKFISSSHRGMFFLLYGD